MTQHQENEKKMTVQFTQFVQNVDYAYSTQLVALWEKCFGENESPYTD